MSIVSFKRPKEMTKEMKDRFLVELREGKSKSTKDCPNLVAEYEKSQKKDRKIIVASEDSGSE